MKINVDEIKLQIKILEDRKTKAIIALDFGEFVVRGYRITESKYENANGERLWLVPPSYPGGGKYHPIAYFTDKNLWLEVEKRIWKEFEVQKEEHFKKFMKVKDEDLAEDDFLKWEDIGKET